MATEKLKNSWKNGKIIAKISLIENLLKIFAAICELIFGKLRNAAADFKNCKFYKVL